MPTKRQLQQIIKDGDDSHNNRLLLNLSGSFELLNYDNEVDEIAFRDKDYITRWETYDKGNGYVGIEASLDEDHLNTIMKWADKAWVIYKESGKTKILNPNI